MPLLREEPPSETYLATAERDTTLQRSLEFSTDKVCFKKDAGLYKTETQKLLKDGVRDYLNAERMKKWHDEYLKNYRDALAHRIPLYVPPKRLSTPQNKQDANLDNEIREAIRNRDFSKMNSLQNEMDSVGDPAPFFVHSLSETEYKYVVLHAQVITDFGTVEEIVGEFCSMFKAG